jgi:hypothetical protein
MFGSRVPRVVIGMVVVVAVVEGAYLSWRYWLTPWARAHDGHPPLVGYWQGAMVVEPGDTRQVTLYLRQFETAREFLLRGGRANWDSTPMPDIRVVAKVCGATGSTRYHGHGDVADRAGTRFTFGLTPERTTLGKHPSSIEGVWDGEDRLDLTGRVYTQRPDGATAETSAAARPSDSNVTGVLRFELRRVTQEAFDASC